MALSVGREDLFFRVVEALLEIGVEFEEDCFDLNGEFSVQGHTQALREFHVFVSQQVTHPFVIQALDDLRKELLNEEVVLDFIESEESEVWSPSRQPDLNFSFEDCSLIRL